MIQKLVDYIIKPQRSNYRISDLGPAEFLVDHKFTCKRIDFEVTSERNYKIQCSIFLREIQEDREYPAIIYCHCNRGNRTECEYILPDLLNMNIVVITFDFSGCGLSEGKHISLGYYEKDQIDSVLNYVKKEFSFLDKKRIGIWGRSMGAVSSILYASSSPEISFLILDSPFQDLSQLLKEYIDRFKIVSKLAGKYIFKNIKKKILEQAKFELDQVSPMKVINQFNIPTLFIHGSKDTIVPIEHSKNLFEAYQGKKFFVEVDVGHNDARPGKIMDIILEFIIDGFTSFVPELANYLPNDSENVSDDEEEVHKISPIHSCEMIVKLEDGPKQKPENKEKRESVNINRQSFSRKSKKYDLCIFGDRKEEILRTFQRSQSYFKVKSLEAQEMSEIVLRRNYSTNREPKLLQNPHITLSGQENKNTLALNTSRAVLSISEFGNIEIKFWKIAVSKGDLEHLETIVTLIEDIKEDELNILDYSVKTDKNDDCHEKKKITLNIPNSRGSRSSQNPRSASHDENLRDSPTPPKNSILENFIDSAAKSNFEKFREKKFIPSLYRFSSEDIVEKKS